MPKSYRQHGVFVITPSGDINHAEMVAIKDLISEELQAGRPYVVLDLCDVSHVNYMTLGVLVERAGRLKRLGGALHLAAVSPYLRRILQFSGVEDLFEIFDSAIEATAAQAAARGRHSLDLVAGASGSWVPQMN